MKSRHPHKQKPQVRESESDLPAALAKPARRALAGAGYVRLEQLTKVSEAEVLQLHGMGPNALSQLRRALAAEGKSFAGKSKNPQEKALWQKSKKS